MKSQPTIEREIRRLRKLKKIPGISDTDFWIISGMLHVLYWTLEDTRKRASTLMARLNKDMLSKQQPK